MYFTAPCPRSRAANEPRQAPRGMQCMQHFEDPLYGGMLGPFMRGDTPYVSQYRRVIGTAGIIGSSLAHKLNHDDLSVSEQDVPPLIDPRHTYSDQSSYCIRNPVIPVEHAEAGELLEESDGEGYS